MTSEEQLDKSLIEFSELKKKLRALRIDIQQQVENIYGIKNFGGIEISTLGDDGGETLTFDYRATDNTIKHMVVHGITEPKKLIQLLDAYTVREDV